MERFERIAVGETGIDDVNADVVLGLCPGCELWQVDYTLAVQQQYLHLRPGNGHLAVDASEWHLLIEDILADHLMSCRHLQRLLVD